MIHFFKSFDNNIFAVKSKSNLSENNLKKNKKVNNCKKKKNIYYNELLQ